MKKTIALVTIAAFVLLAAASFVSAAPTDTAPRFDGPQGQAITLTDDQKKELAPIYDKMLDVQKEMLQKYVSFGYLTQEQADQRAAFMKERMAWHQQNGIGPGMMGRGHGMGKGPGFGPGGRGPCGQQAPATNQ
jgi:hypothetical protein